jgi:3-dehydroquinate synthase
MHRKAASIRSSSAKAPRASVPRVPCVAPSAACTAPATHHAPASHDLLLLDPFHPSLRSRRFGNAFAGVNRKAVQQLRLQKRGAVVPAAVASPPASAAPAAMKTVEVELGDRSYPIYIGAGLLQQGELLRKHIPGKRVLIVTNETVAPLYLEQ